jgi:uncharacterized membrane protein
MKKYLFLLALSLALSLPLFFRALPAAADFSGDPLEQACQNTPDDTTCKQSASTRTNDPIAGENGIINKAANILAVIGGIIAVIFIIIGGFAYVTSGGDAQKVTAAKSRVLSGIVGLLIIAFAWVLVGLVTKVILRT